MENPATTPASRETSWYMLVDTVSTTPELALRVSQAPDQNGVQPPQPLQIESQVASFRESPHVLSSDNNIHVYSRIHSSSHMAYTSMFRWCRVRIIERMQADESEQGVISFLFLHIESENNVWHIHIPPPVNLNNNPLTDMIPMYHKQRRD